MGVELQSQKTQLQKLFVYVETLDKFNTLKLSSNENNTKYKISDTEEFGAPDVKFEQIVFIKDVRRIWTHGSFYNCSEDIINKVTSLTAQSTDDQYPSAKAVYDIITSNEYSTSQALNNLNENKIDKPLIIPRENYSQYIGISSTNENYNKFILLNDGSGILYNGVLYRNNSYWVEVVDELPQTQKDDTIYLIKE